MILGGVCRPPRRVWCGSGVEVRVTKRERDEAGFKPLPLRWRIEAAFGTPGNRRHRLARNLEQSPAAAEDAVSIASCYRLLRAYHRPVGAALPSAGMTGCLSDISHRGSRLFAKMV